MHFIIRWFSNFIKLLNKLCFFVFSFTFLSILYASEILNYHIYLLYASHICTIHTPTMCIVPPLHRSGYSLMLQTPFPQTMGTQGFRSVYLSLIWALQCQSCTMQAAPRPHNSEATSLSGPLLMAKVRRGASFMLYRPQEETEAKPWNPSVLYFTSPLTKD